MKTFPFFCIAAACAAVASAEYAYGDYKEYNVREYTKPGMKCAGAEGYPYVHYAPCTDGYECKEKSTYATAEWGLYCVKYEKPAVGKCYPEGKRCMGAYAKPYVPYYPCCSADLVCKEDVKLGWGSWCLKDKYYVKPVEPVETTAVPVVTTYKYPAVSTTATVAPTKVKYPHYGYGKCHITGARCAGAPMKPYVEYGDGCCSKEDYCVADPKLGWGKYCKSYYYGKPVVTEAPVETTAAPVVTKKPYFGYGYGYYKPETTTTAPPPPKCIKTGYAGCDPKAYYKGYKSCCVYEDECVSDPKYYKGAFYCAKYTPPAASPEAYKYYYGKH